jgi:hypothetical protein
MCLERCEKTGVPALIDRLVKGIEIAKVGDAQRGVGFCQVVTFLRTGRGVAIQ